MDVETLLYVAAFIVLAVVLAQAFDAGRLSLPRLPRIGRGWVRVILAVAAVIASLAITQAVA